MSVHYCVLFGAGAAMHGHWYVAREGQTFGPFTSDRMFEAIRDGELRSDDFAWQDGMLDWQRVSDIPALRLPPPLPPPPSSQEQEASHATPVRDAEQSAPSEEGDAVQHPVGKSLPASGFVLRHWRGELPLVQAYWGVSVLLTLVVIWLSNGFGTWLGKAELPPAANSAAVMGFLSFLCAITVWQLVGVWRSAGNHIASTGRDGWASLARLAVLIGALRASVDFSNFVLPMLRESFDIVRGRDNVQPHQLRLLRNGTEIELAGGMPFGTADAFRKLLDAAPAVQVVHLNSTGGRIGESFQIYQIIRERNLATYTATDCVSACAVAFLAGSKRYLSNQARLGFHSSSFGGLDQKQLPEINADLRIKLTAHGVPSWFIDKALSTSANSMWYPRSEELVTAGIVTHVVSPDQFGMSGIPDWRDGASMERGLLKVPLYSVINEHDPEGFRKISTRVTDALKLGKSQAEMAGDVQAALSDILPKYLQVAPDGIVQRYWRSQLAEMEHLQRVNASLCVAFAYPHLRRQDFNLQNLLPANILAEDVAALTELIKQSVRTPQHQRLSNIDDELDAVARRVSARVPGASEILADPNKHFGNPTALCSVVVAFYRDILSLPQARSGGILRSLAEPTK